VTTTLFRRPAGDRAEARADGSSATAPDDLEYEQVRRVRPHGTAGDATPRLPVDIVDQWGWHSFPASDPPANW
jgi:hypothetical protein